VRSRYLCGLCGFVGKFFHDKKIECLSAKTDTYTKNAVLPVISHRFF